MAKIVLVVAPENFRDEEFFHTKEELEKAGNEVVIVSTKIGTLTGMLGGTTEAIMIADDINESDFDAIVFIGGSGASVYFTDEKFKA